MGLGRQSRHRAKTVSLLCSGGVAIFWPVSASAQRESETANIAAETRPAATGATSYAAQDFARFAPKTARDMLDQVPGFSIKQAEAKRGLGGASANILINGERFSGKSNDILTELNRIAASSVVRIDIVDGSTLNVPGLSGQVANIIVNAPKRLSGQFQWNPQQRFKRTPSRMTNGQASISGAAGKVDFTLGVSNESYVQGNAGPATITDRNGAILDRREERYTGTGEQPKISLGLQHRSASGSAANLNASYQIQTLTDDEVSMRRGPGMVDRERSVRGRKDFWNYELGGDYEFGPGGGRLKLIGLTRKEHNPYVQSVITRFADGGPDAGQRFTLIEDISESIIRGEFGWQWGQANWQIAAEGALNGLDSSSALGDLDVDDGFHMPPFQTASVREKRGEISINYGRPLSPSLTLQASLAGEYSQLSQTGAAGKARVFYRPKGFVSLAWKASPRLDVSAKIEREVGQLNFSDFIASTNLSSETGNAGNPDLVPAQSWKGNFEVARNLGAYGTVTAKLYGRLYQDVVDIVPIGAGGQAPGNLDSATLLGLALVGSFNLDPYGMKGAKIDLKGQYQKTRIKDQLTGVFREINDNQIWYSSINFRHDISKSDWAYGAYYEVVSYAFGYRLDLRRRASAWPGEVGVFVEHKDVMGLTVKAELANLVGTHETFLRTIYDGRRPNPILTNEFRNRDYGPVLTFSISGKF
jgi:outer membrane receptor for ferrienterochelin and colicins